VELGSLGSPTDGRRFIAVMRSLGVTIALCLQDFTLGHPCPMHGVGQPAEEKDTEQVPDKLSFFWLRKCQYSPYLTPAVCGQEYQGLLRGWSGRASLRQVKATTSCPWKVLSGHDFLSASCSQVGK
jgi:hypothetical protein